MNLPTVILLIVVAAMVVMVVRVLVRSGGSTCRGCSACRNVPRTGGARGDQNSHKPCCGKAEVHISYFRECQSMCNGSATCPHCNKSSKS